MLQLPPQVATVIDQLCERWNVTLLDEAPRGDWNLILSATRRGVPCVLKVAGAEHNALDEAIALEAWHGNGAVRLLEADPDQGVLLLEGLNADRSLRTVDLPMAAEIAGRLIHDLAVPAPAGLPHLTELVRRTPEVLRTRQTALGDPISGRWVDTACGLAYDLATDPGNQLVHGDLHYDNILSGARRPWLAIDPKPVIGNPERSVAELMWDRIDEAADRDDVLSLFDALTSAGGLDPARARAWSIVQAVDYWLWGLGAGLTDDPSRCQRLLSSLDP